MNVVTKIWFLVAQITFFTIGTIIFIIAITADWLNIGSPGFGLSQLILAVIGGGLLFAGLALRTSRFRQLAQWLILSRIVLVLIGLFIGLLLAEIGFYVLERVDKNRSAIGGLQQTIEDPKLGVRLPAYAPGHDAKGFRNDHIPEQVDIVAIGDSQTWGVNANRSQAWPQILAKLSGQSVYNMALGYYGSVQYLVLIEEALELSPETIVVGLYFGNDIWGAYQVVYPQAMHIQLRNSQASNALMQDTIAPRVHMLRDEMASLGLQQIQASPFAVLNTWIVRHSAVARQLAQMGWWPGNTPEVQYQAAKAWAQTFPAHGAVYENGDVHTVLTTAYRLLALDLDEPRIAEGLRITKEVLLDIKTAVDIAGVKLLVVLIPTKEMVYAGAVEHWKERDSTYTRLVQMETQVRNEIKSLCDENDIAYVDVLPVLINAVERNEQIYPSNTDGHPNAKGYFFIASAVNEALNNQGWGEAE